MSGKITTPLSNGRNAFRVSFTLMQLLHSPWRQFAGGRTMFTGKAELINPETGKTVATFTESCETEGSATAKVVLKHAIELKDSERLEVFGTVKDVPVISVGAKDPVGSEIHEFSGKSAVGCLPDKMEISLVKTPGGRLGTLLIVLGTGTIHHYR
jgi:hypothetical protein